MLLGLKITYIIRYILHRYKLQDILTIESPEDGQGMPCGSLKCQVANLGGGAPNWVT